MRFIILSALCLLGSSFAAPTSIGPRDMTVINYNFGRVQAALNILDQGMARKPAFSDQQGTITYVKNRLQATNQAINEFTTGAAEIRRGPSINDLEAVGLNTPANAAVNSLNKIIANWVSIKRQAGQVGAQSAVLSALTQLESSAGTFMDAINIKAGFISGGIGSMYKTSLTSAVRKGVDAYKWP